MAKIFCIANQKGGVGKTTTTVNLAAGLAKLGQRVLMVDLDPQGNATMGSGIDKRQLKLSVYDVLLESASVTEARQKSEKLIEAGCGYDILGANRDLAGAEVEMVDIERREKRLKLALAAVDSEYDFVLIDCPPSLSMLTLNGLCCAQRRDCAHAVRVLCARRPDRSGQHHQAGACEPEPPIYRIIGLLRVMFDPRITLQQQVSDQLKGPLWRQGF
jgi:chromosome partitioning protein